MLTPLFLPADRLELWAAYWGVFFVLAYLVARFLGLTGLSGLGMVRHSGWSGNLATGFLAGAAVYALKYAAFSALGKFEVTGVMPGAYILQTVLLAVVAMLFSSLLNDVVIRGYLYSAGQHHRLVKLFLPASVFLYVLTDAWMAGFGWVNLVFSGILGLAFGYTVLKTGSIWMSFGLHWGGNVMYRMMYGFNGQGILKLADGPDRTVYDLAGLGITALMLPVTFLVLEKRRTARQAEVSAGQPDLN